MDPSIHPILLWLLLGFSRSEKQAEPSFLLPLDSFKLFICLTVFFFFLGGTKVILRPANIGMITRS